MAGPSYDAILHTAFLGFVMTMIFAHTPIVFPAVLHLPVAYTPRSTLIWCCSMPPCCCAWRATSCFGGLAGNGVVC